jgi:NAD(P)-dependent dehydrogenase (short-subunit alcohol dehydrogenase family)
MRIENSVALVTGANRGIGRAFARALLERGARIVYGAARDPSTITDPGITPIRLDITDAGQVAAAAELATDVNLLINNAGSNRGGAAFDPSAVDAIRADFETNVIGTLTVTRAFAPVLAANGGGAVLNVLSAVSWLAIPRGAGYSASKAALWSLTNSLRLDLLGQHTLVSGLHVGFVDTDMIAHLDVPKSQPDQVVAAALDGIEAGLHEVLADDISRTIKRGLAEDLPLLYPALAAGPVH